MGTGVRGRSNSTHAATRDEEDGPHDDSQSELRDGLHVVALLARIDGSHGVRRLSRAPGLAQGRWPRPLDYVRAYLRHHWTGSRSLDQARTGATCVARVWRQPPTHMRR
jgi:hypothetical protein